MDDIAKKFQVFARSVENICSHISVREDENGPFIFALGEKEIHTLQMRKINNCYALELWYGPADEEDIVEEPTFTDIEEGFAKAKEWLEKDIV